MFAVQVAFSWTWVAISQKTLKTTGTKGGWRERRRRTGPRGVCRGSADGAFEEGDACCLKFQVPASTGGLCSAERACRGSQAHRVRANASWRARGWRGRLPITRALCADHGADLVVSYSPLRNRALNIVNVDALSKGSNHMALSF